MKKLSKALNDNAAITIRLSNKELTGPHELLLTKTDKSFKKSKIKWNRCRYSN